MLHDGGPPTRRSAEYDALLDAGGLPAKRCSTAAASRPSSAAGRASTYADRAAAAGSSTASPSCAPRSTRRSGSTGRCASSGAGPTTTGSAAARARVGRERHLRRHRRARRGQEDDPPHDHPPVPAARAVRALRPPRRRRDPALRPAGLRQDAARTGDRRRVRAPVLERPDRGDPRSVLRDLGAQPARDLRAGARTSRRACSSSTSSTRSASPAASTSGSAGRALVDQVLQELDAIGADNEGILVLAATNAPWDVDEALKRPGRFDRLIFVPPPDVAAREQILALHLRGSPSRRRPEGDGEADAALQRRRPARARRAGRRRSDRRGARLAAASRRSRSATSTRRSRVPAEHARVARDRAELRRLREPGRPLRRGRALPRLEGGERLEGLALLRVGLLRRGRRATQRAPRSTRR